MLCGIQWFPVALPRSLSLSHTHTLPVSLSPPLTQVGDYRLVLKGSLSPHDKDTVSSSLPCSSHSMDFHTRSVLCKFISEVN